MSYVHASIVYCTCVSVCARTHTLTQNCTQLVMVDLAGSETVKKTGAEGQTLKEAQVLHVRVVCVVCWPSRRLRFHVSCLCCLLTLKEAQVLHVRVLCVFFVMRVGPQGLLYAHRMTVENTSIR